MKVVSLTDYKIILVARRRIKIKMKYVYEENDFINFSMNWFTFCRRRSFFSRFFIKKHIERNIFSVLSPLRPFMEGLYEVVVSVIYGLWNFSLFILILLIYQTSRHIMRFVWITILRANEEASKKVCVEVTKKLYAHYATPEKVRSI